MELNIDAIDGLNSFFVLSLIYELWMAKNKTLRVLAISLVFIPSFEFEEIICSHKRLLLQQI